MLVQYIHNLIKDGKLDAARKEISTDREIQKVLGIPRELSVMQEAELIQAMREKEQ